MRDFQTLREKKLDLVVARPAGSIDKNSQSFKGLADQYGIRLNAAEQAVLDTLPDIRIANVGAVLIALEAKAAMTAHQKARPRLYDELNSSHLCVHGASAQALAIGYVQINSSPVFLSSVSNGFSFEDRPPKVSKHDQPKAVLQVLEKIAELPRRTGQTGTGFDGLGVTILDFENRGGRVDVVNAPPAPQEGDPFHYGSMIVRMSNEYDSRFQSI